MTRSSPSPVEILIRDRLIKHLQSVEQKVEIVQREIEDRPDIVLRIGKNKIACECTQYPSNKVMDLYKRRVNKLKSSAKKLTAIRTIIPNEIHSFVREAIERKNPKIDLYKRKSDAAEVWLIVHIDPIFRNQKFGNKDPQTIATYGAQTANHRFDRIYLFDEQIGLAQIFPSQVGRLQIEHDLTNGYPTVSFTLIAGTKFATTAGPECPPTVYEYEIEESYSIIVPPLDPDFKARAQPAMKQFQYSRVRIIAYHDGANIEFLP